VQHFELGAAVPSHWLGSSNDVYIVIELRNICDFVEFVLYKSNTT
jgi:hypothetical protein